MNGIPYDELDGYRMAAPSTAALIEDAKIVEAHTCPVCGTNYSFTPYYRANPYSYRAFAVCGKCGHAEEV